MGNGQDHFLTTGKIASVPTATHNNNSWRAWWCRAESTSLKSMAELDDMLCMQSQFQPHAPRAIQFFIPEYGCLPIERLSIKRMQDLGAFPAVLDDINFKFSQGGMLPDLSSLFMLYHSVHLKGRLQTRLQTNCQSIHLYITSPY